MSPPRSARRGQGRKRWGNVLLILLFVGGASLLLYPTVSNWLASRNHSKAIVEYAVSVEQLNRQEIEHQLARARAYNAALTAPVSGDAFSLQETAAVPEEYFSVLNINGVIGYISIPAINAYLPIYHTTSEEVLRKGVGHLYGTAFPIGGDGGHAVLTAHRGLPSARLFTDLNKLDINDLFYVHVLDKVLCYQVETISVVEPYETDQLQPVPGQDTVTLVTCTPYAINSHRLLVKGSLVPHLPEESVVEQMERELDRGIWLVGSMICVPVVLAVFVLVRKRRTGKRDKN